MRATFEEKTYENYFNVELDSHTDIFFPLGQVQEGNLGFDSSAFSRSRRFWRRFGYPFWFFPHFGGIELRQIANEMEFYLEETIANIPNMKANLLFQYKKPEYLTTTKSKEWSNWNQSYFRYDIYKEQQDLLMQIHKKFGTKILILYASPAIYDVNDLIKKKRNRQIIEYSNFKKSAELDGHSRNTYIKAGNYSIAFSDPERIENTNLLRELESLGNTNEKDSNETNRQFIINFRRQIVEVTYENTFYGESFRSLNELTSKFNRNELFYSFLIMSNFRQLTGTQWLIRI